MRHENKLEPWRYCSADKLRKALDSALPPIVTRKKAAEITGGLVTSKVLANCDAAGIGVGEKIYVGKQVGYFKEQFIDFIVRRMRFSSAL
jgi:hypothetical protein